MMPDLAELKATLYLIREAERECRENVKADNPYHALRHANRLLRLSNVLVEDLTPTPERKNQS